MVGNLRAVAARRGPARLSVMALAREAGASTKAVAAGVSTGRQYADGSIGPCLVSRRQAPRSNALHRGSRKKGLLPSAAATQQHNPGSRTTTPTIRLLAECETGINC